MYKNKCSSQWAPQLSMGVLLNYVCVTLLFAVSYFEHFVEQSKWRIA